MHKKHKHKQHRTYTRKELIRRDVIKSIALCAAVLIPALAAVLLMDYFDTNRQEPVLDTPPEAVVEPQATTTTTEPEVEEIATLPLPKETYAYVGQPITFHFLNLTGYNSLEDIQVEVETGGKGKVYADRWEYTPAKAETVEFEFTARDKKDAVVSQGTCIIRVKDRSEKDKLKLLVIGDSTIEAGYETEYLLDLAHADNYDITLLGTQTTPYLSNANNRHEGRGGWRADQCVKKGGFDGAINPFFNPTDRSFDFRYYMESQWYTDVDCVCIQLGINDVFGALDDKSLDGTLAPQYLKNMQHIIDSIHKYDPDIKVVWHLVLPGSTDEAKFKYAYEMSQTAERYKRNTYLTNLKIIELAEEMENVYVVPTNAALNTKENMAASGHGAVHPGKLGYEDIATQLYSFIRAIN